MSDYSDRRPFAGRKASASASLGGALLRLAFGITFTAGFTCSVIPKDVGPDAVSDGSDGPVEVPDDLPISVGRADVVIGLADAEGHAFSLPVPLGADSEGDVYVLDRVLLEIRRFDARGNFEGLVVRAGEGPGEMRVRPFTFDLDSDTIWYSEIPTGRIHFVPIRGGAPWIEETGWTALRLGVESAHLTHVKRWPEGEFLLRTERGDRLGGGARSPMEIILSRTMGRMLDTLYRYEATGPFVYLDGGAVVRFPGPNYHPVVLLHGERGELIRIDRRIAADGGSALIEFLVMDDRGTVRRRKELAVPSQRMTDAERARVTSELIRRSTFDGVRSLAPEVTRELSTVVEQLPERFPAFTAVAPGPDGSIWLGKAKPVGGEMWEWLVVDSSLTAIARARIPGNVQELTYRSDGAWWAVLQDSLDVSYVARFRFDRTLHEEHPDPR